MIHKYKNYYFSIYRHRNIDNLPENPIVAVYMSQSLDLHERYTWGNKSLRH
jgi:hypothetical protein